MVWSFLFYEQGDYKSMKEQILDIMNKKDYQPLDINELYHLLNLKTAKEFTELAKALNQMVDEKKIAYNSKGQFATLSYFNITCGIIDVKEAGFAFIDTEFGGIFVPPGALKGAITHDEVMVKFHFDNKGRLEGEVTEIIKRNNTELIGILSKRHGKNIVKPLDYKVNLMVFIKDDGLKNAKPNDIVKVKVDKFYLNATADGIVLKTLGNKNLPGLDISALVMTSNVKTEFPDTLNEELKFIPNFIDASEECKINSSRKDLRDKLIITIDGDDAKDLDDAISIEKLANGNYLLGVYIADVANYVKENSLLDEEAFLRGTSIYLPDRVIPMLPKKLSNGICSLNEKVDRLVMACEMEIDEKGKVINYDIFEAIINSSHRMTYNNVNKILEDKDQDTIKKYQDIVPMLKQMKKLAKILNIMRLKRGSFEFESLEPKLILDEKGKVVRIDIRVQRTAEKLIEEFMLIANETVAEAMTWLDVPFIYRVHEKPNEEKVTKLLFALDQFGYNIKIKNKKALPKILQQILLDMEDPTRLERKKIKDAIISRLMIRSMAKAKYQEENIGHFGLASDCYTHFTSPIRRYPDLLVHRLIKQFMLGKKETLATNPMTYFASKVSASGIQSSMTEKKAEQLERDCVDFKKTEYMNQFIGQTFSGIITSVTPYGLYIMLDNTVEGLVKYTQMIDDYYEVDELKGSIMGEKTHKTYQIGDRVVIRVMSTNLEKRIIEFRILRKDNKTDE